MLTNGDKLSYVVCIADERTETEIMGAQFMPPSHHTNFDGLKASIYYTVTTAERTPQRRCECALRIAAAQSINFKVFPVERTNPE